VQFDCTGMSLFAFWRFYVYSLFDSPGGRCCPDRGCGASRHGG
jgi:hypothetical protein